MYASFDFNYIDYSTLISIFYMSQEVLKFDNKHIQIRALSGDYLYGFLDQAIGCERLGNSADLTRLIRETDR